MADDLDLELDPAEDTEFEEVDDGSDEHEAPVEDSDDEVEEDPAELERGYLRQADYTRKTQEVARLRQEAEAAIEQARQMQQFLMAQAQQRQAPPQEEVYLDPLERELQQTKALTVQVAQTMQAQMFQAQAEALAAQVAKDFKVEITGDEILVFATQKNGLPLDIAAETLAARKEREARSAQAAAVKNAKRSLPPSDGSGSRSAPKSQGAKGTFTDTGASYFDRFFGKG